MRELDGVTGLHGENLGVRRRVHVAAAASHGLRVVRGHVRWVMVVPVVPVLVGSVGFFIGGRLVTGSENRVRPNGESRRNNGLKCVIGGYDIPNIAKWILPNAIVREPHE